MRLLALIGFLLSIKVWTTSEVGLRLHIFKRDILHVLLEGLGFSFWLNEVIGNNNVDVVIADVAVLNYMLRRYMLAIEIPWGHRDIGMNVLRRNAAFVVIGHFVKLWGHLLITVLNLVEGAVFGNVPHFAHLVGVCQVRTIVLGFYKWLILQHALPITILNSFCDLRLLVSGDTLIREESVLLVIISRSGWIEVNAYFEVLAIRNHITTISLFIALAILVRVHFEEVTLGKRISVWVGVLPPPQPYPSVSEVGVCPMMGAGGGMNKLFRFLCHHLFKLVLVNFLD